VGRRVRYFFGTRSDLGPGIRDVEAGRGLVYVLNELPERPEFKRFASLLEAPDLGRNPTGTVAQGPQYFVATRDFSFPVTRVPQKRGGVRYAISPGDKGIVVSPGGLYDEKTLIAGSVGTTSEDPAAMQLYELYRKALTRGFERVKNYDVGPEALGILRGGGRLVTIGIRSPREYDLAE